ncbi:MAG: carbamate kinase [Halanaerobiales bacterium]|nr:carbamate kinase [Halanaerobiales bacterium]
MARMVIALGGNALGKTPAEQKKAVKNTATALANLIEEGHELILTHGNGPQVGMINLAFENSADNGDGTPEMPFPECGAMSQGYIGFHLQNAIGEELRERGINKTVSTVITQVVVAYDDPAFQNPSKPIGNFYRREEAERYSRAKGYQMIEDAGRGYRRVVPSPLPVDIVEKKVIETLLKIGEIVISCGGGGIPVIRQGNKLLAVSAVIDKDYVGEKLAEVLAADFLVILTAVERVALNYGQKDQQWLSSLEVATAKRYCEEGHFAAGSMLPKIKAAIEFAESGPGRKTLITSLEKVQDGLSGKTGTVITVETG